MNYHQSEKDDSQIQKDDLQALTVLRKTAPPGFQRRVTAAISEREKGMYRGKADVLWALPRLSGILAAATVLVCAVIFWPLKTTPPDGVESVSSVTFKLNAPEARKVELIGDFTAWQAGQINFEGPDGDGTWQVVIELPEGRYEYLFLVDGQQWVTDTDAPAHRSDGFGNMNAIINL